MKIHLRITGGMGLTLTGALDVEDLPDELNEKIGFLLTPKMLTSAALAQPPSQAVGMREFEVTIVPDTQPTDAKDSRVNEPQHFHLTEADGNIEVVDLLDELMREIVIRKQAG